MTLGVWVSLDVWTSAHVPRLLLTPGEMVTRADQEADQCHSTLIHYIHSPLHPVTGRH